MHFAKITICTIAQSKYYYVLHPIAIYFWVMGETWIDTKKNVKMGQSVEKIKAVVYE